MKKLFCLIVLIAAQTASADCVLFKGQYSYDAIAHLNDDVIFKGQYSYDAIAHSSGCTTAQNDLLFLLVSIGVL